MNYWGEHPRESWFVAQNNSVIDWEPYLEDPVRSSAAPLAEPVPAEAAGSKVDIGKAMGYRVTGDYQRAKSVLSAAVHSDQPNSEIHQAAVELVALHALTHDPELLQICQFGLARENRADPIFALAEAKILHQSGRITDARGKLDRVIRLFPGTDFAKMANVDICLSTLADEAFSELAASALNSLRELSPDDEYAKLFLWLWSLQKHQMPPQLQAQPMAKNGIEGITLALTCDAFPNPFNPSTTIRYSLPLRSIVHLAIYNALGQEVVVLSQGEQDAGCHEVPFDGSNLSSGVYFYRIQAGNLIQTRRFLLLK